MWIDLPMLDAKRGRGCDHCEAGVDIEEVETAAGARVKLCVECVLAWYQGRKDITWWENNHAPFRDHVTDRLRAAREREMEAWEKWVGTLPSDKMVKVGH